MELAFYFPQGKRKALTFSYDDGSPWDCQLLEIFNRYGMKATFNLHTLNKDLSGIKNLYAGHEIACHGKTHPYLERIPAMSALEDILENRKELEAATSSIINGMAYPFGTYSNQVKEILRSSGILYSRTTRSTSSFSIPEDFLEWHPTCHHNENLKNIAESFLKRNYPFQLCYVWGHSYEFNDQNNWEVIEEFCAATAHQENIWYATNMEIFEYITAARSLIFSADSRIVKNPSAIPVWIGTDSGKILEICGGATLCIF